ncbi:MAG: metallophosphoesterase [Phycisphaerae bacterium]
MRIGLVSDTHDRLPTLHAALERFAQLGVETLIHPGDVIAPFAAKVLAGFPGKLYIIYGNNDGERAGLQEVLPQIQQGPLWLDLAGKRILLHHFVEWCRAEDLARADIIVSGHTHRPAIEPRDGKLFVNPGECCGWVTGRATVAIIDLKTSAAELIEVPT